VNQNGKGGKIDYMNICRVLLLNQGLTNSRVQNALEILEILYSWCEASLSVMSKGLQFTIDLMSRFYNLFSIFVTEYQLNLIKLKICFFSSQKQTYYINVPNPFRYNDCSESRSLIYDWNGRLESFSPINGLRLYRYSRPIGNLNAGIFRSTGVAPRRRGAP
jgi:hypothetical protein